MSLKPIVKLSFLSLSVLFLLQACRTDKLRVPEMMTSECASSAVTYNLQIKEIIDTYCAVSGCHAPGGDGPGDFTSYPTMAPYLTATSFEKFVVELKDDPISGMPPDWGTASAPQDLTDEDFELVVCWIAEGYLEN